MLLMIIYWAVAVCFFGGLVGTDEEMAKTTMSGSRLPMWTVAIASAFWLVIVAGAPAYFLFRWWTARKPDVIAKRLQVADAKCAKTDVKGNW